MSKTPAHPLSPPSEDLPIQAVLEELTDLVRDHRAVVLTAPPGAGKTTLVPLALHRAGLSAAGQVLVLQPRRLAARATARRMAASLGERVGQTVGHQIRFDRRAGPETRVLVVTEGILTRRLLADPFLEGVACVVLDEFHERSVHLDLALAFLRQLIEVRDDLKLVIMSATLDPEPIQAFLGGCPHLDCPVREHPLVVDYLTAPDERPLPERVRSGLAGLLADPDEGGDVLVFLSGASEIQRTQALLAQRPLPGHPEVIGLYGALPATEQDRALRPGRSRRVVLSTNIAETSLTVPRVTRVVDTGLVKRPVFDPRSGMDRLVTGRVSRASADQRAGRAGRIGPGRVLRLWTGADQAGLVPADTPALLRCDLAPIVMWILAFEPGAIENFGFFQPPPAAGLRAALDLLTKLGAVAADGQRLTAQGRRLAELPIHPRLGAVLVRSAEAGLGRAGALLCALLAERDLLSRSAAVKLPTCDSDLLLRREWFEQLERDSFPVDSARRLGVSPGAARDVARARDQLAGLAAKLAPAGEVFASSEDATLRRAVLAGFPDRVCRRRKPGSQRALMVGGRGVRLAAESAVRDAQLFVALQADAGRRQARSDALVRVASQIEEVDLEAVFPDLVCELSEPVFDPNRAAVIGVRRRWFGDLLLAEQPGQGVEPERAARVLADALEGRFDQAFAPDRAGQAVLARLRFAAAHLADADWPPVDEAGLLALLRARCAGRKSFAELRRLDWSSELLGRLSWKQRKLLDTQVPERIQVPSGRAVRIVYPDADEPDPVPVLAVKLQELFGLTETPRIARGRVSVILHLLAPNGRPAQVTRDLASFWAEGYPQVRKELRGRYPKHPWPEDPLSAEPTGRTKRRR